ncbi:DUF1648 domain-containing protein [Nocardiopsis suaedae]|uniref:DUF1648 domain-containing protein n=1 Tax=Nocardiopsis suaedae TaxID=3018444 RepID=A0ABT4TIT5_9ACTN|nr:DUF1648 domain-containing protein [Nocardiopsis suaedae]MDA2804276.1 hypothetical protein [Nocardiopsis suaedae]
MPPKPTRAGYAPPPYPKVYLAPALVLLLGQVIVGAAVYPRLPGELPVHFSGPGTVTATAATGPLTALGPVLVGAGVLLLLAFSAALVLRTVPEDRLVDFPDADRTPLSAFVNRPADRADAVTGARSVLLTAGIVQGVFALVCAAVWFPERVGASAWFFPAVLVLCAASVLPVIAVRLLRRSGSAKQVL